MLVTPLVTVVVGTGLLVADGENNVSPLVIPTNDIVGGVTVLELIDTYQIWVFLKSQFPF